MQTTGKKPLEQSADQNGGAANHVGRSIRPLATEVWDRTVPDADTALDPDESGYTLKIAGIYQDNITRDWATQSCDLAIRLVGEKQVQSIFFDANSLNDPGIFLEAINATIVADVIVVAVYAANELSAELYTWIDVWLPRRQFRPGVMAALVGAAEPLDSQSILTQEYLRAVAHKGQLDFIPQERKRPASLLVSSIKLIAEQATPIALMHQKVGDHLNIHSGWGLNER